jgi:hypothetical protein
MGQREDVVRKRQEEQAELERQRVAAAEREQARQYANLLARHANMFAEFSEQEARIAALLRDEDWSKEAILRTFRYDKKHWWSRQKKQEFACLRFGDTFGEWNLYCWIRSDGRLFMGDSYSLVRPQIFFAPHEDKERLSRQLLVMRSVLNDLNKYDGPKKRLP